MELQQIALAICEKEGFRFCNEVGSGEYKETFHVFDSRDRSVALKVYKPAVYNDRSKREIEAMQRCHHPNIARLLSISDIVVDNLAYLYITEEYLSGGTLTSIIQTRPLERAEVINFGSQLIDAVSHLYDLDLVHRDIKPDNLLFRNPQEIVISDFGLVRDLSAATLTAKWFSNGPGTPFFASPEQLKNEQSLIKWWSDQFAIGIVLAFSIYGEHPYDIKGNYHPADRVAMREKPCPKATAFLERQGLGIINKMISPWSINRYRIPNDLKSDWERL